MSSRRSSPPLPLWELCGSAHLVEVRAALGRGEQVNSASDRGVTGLMNALNTQRNSIVEFLLCHQDTDVNLVDRFNSTALHSACRADNSSGLKKVLAHPGLTTLNTRSSDALRSPLMEAVWNGSLACFRVLAREEGVNLDTRDGQGRTLEEVAR